MGAGPGDPDLLTIKGMKALQTADVVLYDALANEALLEFAPASALRVFVGKRAGQHSHTQEAINMMLVEMAFAHGHVVRLKGGDAFVFGRGQEEMAFAQAFGIAVDVVPGISSCIALPELQGVPLTRRGTSESFWVTTATTRRGVLSEDVALAAQSTATVVILMGMSKLAQIVAVFKQNGKAQTPVMIVQDGSTADERVLVGKVEDIAERAHAENMGAPAVIVIGEVVAFQAERKRLKETALPGLV